MCFCSLFVFIILKHGTKSNIEGAQHNGKNVLDYSNDGASEKAIANAQIRKLLKSLIGFVEKLFSFWFGSHFHIDRMRMMPSILLKW